MPVAEDDDGARPRAGRTGGRVRFDRAVDQREDGVARAADAVVLGRNERIGLGHAGREDQDDRDGRREAAGLAADAAGQWFRVLIDIRHCLTRPAPTGATEKTITTAAAECLDLPLDSSQESCPDSKTPCAKPPEDLQICQNYATRAL